MSDRLYLSALAVREESAVRRLRDALRMQGFACVVVDQTPLADALEAALTDAAGLDGFRFPPIDDSTPQYTPIRREAFQRLFEISTTCLDALLYNQRLPTWLQEALLQLRRSPAVLFAPDNQGHEPFQSGQPFQDSFFNLFNYDRGLLNAHVDRSLLTIIKVQQPPDDGAAHSALWVRGPDDQWRDADAAVQADEVLVLVGEDCAELPCAQTLGVHAAEHAVRVDPNGEYVSHSHFRPDPGSMPEQNRRSAAFILRHEAPQRAQMG